MKKNKETKTKEKQKTSETVVSILIIIIGGAVIYGSFYLGQLIGINSIGNEENPNVIIANNDPVETGYEDISDDIDLIKKLENEFIVPTKIIPLLRNGSTNDFVEFAKIYISLFNIVNNKDNRISCDDNAQNGCVNEDKVLAEAKRLFGNSVLIANKNYTDFNNYSFNQITVDNSLAGNGYYDETKKNYVIKNLISNSNAEILKEDFIKVPYRLLKKDNTFKLSYYIVYKSQSEEAKNECIYYLNENKNNKIFTLRNEEIKNEISRIKGSPIREDFKRITLTLEKNGDNYTFTNYKIEN